MGYNFTNCAIIWWSWKSLLLDCKCLTHRDMKMVISSYLSVSVSTHLCHVQCKFDTDPTAMQWCYLLKPYLPNTVCTKASLFRGYIKVCTFCSLIKFILPQKLSTIKLIDMKGSYWWIFRFLWWNNYTYCLCSRKRRWRYREFIAFWACLGQTKHVYQ